MGDDPADLGDDQDRLRIWRDDRADELRQQRLGVGQFCSLSTLIDNSTAYACVATAASIANLRGGLVFHKHFLNESGSLTLHPIRFAPLR